MIAGDIPIPPAVYLERTIVDRLADALESAPIVALIGGRGAGKTHIAASYARRVIEHGEGVVGWINAESKTTMTSDLAHLADSVGIADPGGDTETLLRRLREHLGAATGARLIVFDNATDPDLMIPYLRTLGSTHLVITSTDRQFGEIGTAIGVENFTRAESIAYLAHRIGYPDDTHMNTIAERLGDLPLALSAAASTINARGIDCAEYLVLLDSGTLATALARRAGQPYPLDTETAVSLQIDKVLDETDSGTNDLLALIAVLSPQGVRRKLLHRLSPTGREAIDAAIEPAVRMCVLSYSLGGRSITMHRITARTIRERLSSDDRTRVAKMALALLIPEFADDVSTWRDSDRLNKNFDHVNALWETTIAGHDHRALAILVLNTRIQALQQLVTKIGDPVTARGAGEHVVQDSSGLLGPDDLGTLAARSACAYIALRSGQLAAATVTYESIHAIQLRDHGPDHPATLRTANDLAGAYRAAGRLDAAIALYERTRTAMDRVLGPDHHETLSATDNLAVAYTDAGRFEQAIVLHRHTARIRERLLGADDPETLTSRNNLAYVHLMAEHLAEARAQFTAVLSDSTRVLGPDHQRTIITRSNLATAHLVAGDFDTATVLFERVLEDDVRLFGVAYPGTLTACSNLANAYQHSGRLTEAIELYESARRARVRLLDPGHPAIIITRINLATAHADAGHHALFDTLSAEILRDCRRILGPNHPLTFTARINLATAHLNSGHLSDAVALNRQILTDAEHALGPDHPATINARNNLAGAYQATGRTDQAITTLERTVTDAEQILGPDHPLTATITRTLHRLRDPDPPLR